MTFSFAHVHVLSGTVLFATAVLDEFDEEDICHTVMLERRASGWGFWEARTRIIGLHAYRGAAGDTVLGVGFAGDVQERSPAGIRWERIGSGPDMPSTLRRLTCVRAVEGEIFAAGMGRQVFRRSETGGTWVRADAGALIARGAFELNGFTSIDGFTTQELYACGLKGEIWSTKAGVWSRLETPTNVTLTTIRCLDTGWVLVGGAGGILLIGRGARWRVLDHSATTSGIVTIEALGNSIFVTTERGELFELANEELRRIETGVAGPPMLLTLSAGDGILAAAGGQDLLVFDNRTWTRLDTPF